MSICRDRPCAQYIKIYPFVQFVCQYAEIDPAHSSVASQSPVCAFPTACHCALVSHPTICPLLCTIDLCQTTQYVHCYAQETCVTPHNAATIMHTTLASDPTICPVLCTRHLWYVQETCVRAHNMSNAMLKALVYSHHNTTKLCTGDLCQPLHSKQHPPCTQCMAFIDSV